MKKIYFLLLLLPIYTHAQDVVFGDPFFASTIILSNPTLDTNGDNIIQVSEAQAVTELVVTGSSISNDISGLEEFVNLTSFTWRMALMHSVALDLTFAPNLTYIDLNGSRFSSVNLTGLVHVTHFDMADGVAPDIDLSPFAGILEYLDMSYTYDSFPIDYTDFPNLKYLNIYAVTGNSNDYTSLTDLEYLNCGFGEVNPTFNVTGLASLKTLKCVNLGLTSIDISTLTALQHLDVFDNSLTTINLSGHNLTTLNIAYNNIASLDLSGQTNLVTLVTNSNPLTSLDVSACTQLETLSCFNNDFTALDVSMLPGLKKLDCSDTAVGSLNLGNQTLLEELDCSRSGLSALDLSNNAALGSLRCAGNNLASLDLSANPQLKMLNCSYNQLASIDLSNATLLSEAHCENNLLVSLDFGALVTIANIINDAIYSFGNNPLLTYVNLKNSASTYTFYETIEGPLNCPLLEYVCTKEDSLMQISMSLNGQGATGVTYNSYCSFEPGGTTNNITGTITMDIDSNGCGAGDSHIQGIKINLNDGTNTGSTFTNANGNFLFYNGQGSFTITPELENPYFTVTPAPAILDFLVLDGSTQNLPFCITPNGIHNDLEVSIIPTDPARPGFDAHYLITYKNKGNQILSGTVNLAFDDSILDFVTASPATTTTAANVLAWDFTALEPFQTRAINLTMNVNSPLETPAVNIDDHLFYTVSITANNDETPDDNQMMLDQIVVGSFDPNDKTCAEGSVIRPDMVGDYLHYVIRFQNSGTFYAENVVVTDVIDTNKFDLASLQLTASSHPHTTRITGNKVEFIFEGINLPAEQDDEPGSHGFVAFKIKTKPNLVLNDVVENTADIFFDFNAPITTNTTSTTVSNLGIGDVADIKVSMRPNPVTDMLYVSAEDDIQSIQVFDLQGRLLQTHRENDTQAAIDFADKTTGVYFVKVTTGKGSDTEKIIKE